MLLLHISFDFYFYGIPFSIPSLSVCYVSVDLKWVSSSIYMGLFKILSASLHLLVGAFNLFTIKVIIGMYVLIAIFFFFYKQIFIF